MHEKKHHINNYLKKYIEKFFLFFFYASHLNCSTVDSSI